MILRYPSQLFFRIGTEDNRRRLRFYTINKTGNACMRLELKSLEVGYSTHLSLKKLGR